MSDYATALSILRHPTYGAKLFPIALIHGQRPAIKIDDFTPCGCQVPRFLEERIQSLDNVIRRVTRAPYLTVWLLLPLHHYTTMLKRTRMIYSEADMQAAITK